MTYCRERYIVLNTKEEILNVISEINSSCLNIYTHKRDNQELGYNCYIEERESKYIIEYKSHGKATKYVFDRDGQILSTMTPHEASKRLALIEKIPPIKIDTLGSTKPILYKNKKFDGIAVEAYEYDLSHAYLQMLKLPMPDMSTMRKDDFVHKGEIGFYNMDTDLKMTLEENAFCEYVFNLKESPYVEWATKLEQSIENETDPLKKENLKNIYRYAVGASNNKNKFFRATIVSRCNQLIKSLILKDSTIYCNTDSIVSSVRRKDIESMSGFKWKLKRENQIFKWQKDTFNYQWNDEIPTYRGPKKRFIYYYNKKHEKPWNILEDSVPDNLVNLYTLVLVEGILFLEENEYEKDRNI